jgi:hypothetical protein
MTWYPYNPNAGQELQTDAAGVNADRGFIAHIGIVGANAGAADPVGLHAAHTDDGAPEVFLAAALVDGGVLPVARTITATADGVAGDIKAVSVLIEGTDISGAAITETLPAFTVDTAGTVAGTKAFKTVTKVTIPAHDGNGATTSIGFSQVLGLPYKLKADSVIMAMHNDTRESVAPTVTTDGQSLCNNTIELDTNLDGHDVDIFLIV